MDTCQNIYQTGRKNAGYTQEQAAGFLAIDDRTLRNYESGAAPVPEDIAEKMAVLYKAPFLRYQHARTHATAAGFLPEIGEIEPSRAALQVMCAGKNFELVQTKMMMLAADGKIDVSEAGEWDEVIAAAQTVIRAAFTLIFARKEGAT